jgi:hypothetical protein
MVGRGHELMHGPNAPSRGSVLPVTIPVILNHHYSNIPSRIRGSMAKLSQHYHNRGESLSRFYLPVRIVSSKAQLFFCLVQANI